MALCNIWIQKVTYGTKSVMVNDKGLNFLCLSQVPLDVPGQAVVLFCTMWLAFANSLFILTLFYLLFTEGFEGRSEYHFITNVPPRNGNCTVSPTEGKVLETYFNIKCPGWHDEDGVFIYKVLHGENLIQHGQEATLVPSLLPQGLAQNNYTYNLTVQIFDKYNSFSEETLSVTVSIDLCQDLVLHC